MARSAIGLPDIKIQRDYLLATFVTQMYIRLVHIYFYSIRKLQCQRKQLNRFSQ